MEMVTKTKRKKSQERKKKGKPLKPLKMAAIRASLAASMAAVGPHRGGLTRLFSTSAFNFTPPSPPKPTTDAPPAQPNPNLFVSGLNKRTTSEKLREEFSKFGQVVQAKVVTDRVSGFSKGFGFVRYETTEEAGEGIKGMDGKFLDGWVIFAEYAKPRPEPGSTPLSQPLNRNRPY